MPVGLRINLPSGSAYQAGGQDTLAGIAERFSLSVATSSRRSPTQP